MNGRIIFGIILIGIGISLLTSIPVFNFIIALIIIWIGWRVLSGHNPRWHDNWETEQDESEDYIHETLVFSGVRKNIDSDNFKGGKITSVFGGGEFDLSGVKTKEDTLILDVDAVFGGIRLRIPENWIVRSEVTAIIGGIDNRTKPKGKDITLRLRGSSVFGGIEIYN